MDLLVMLYTVAHPEHVARIVQLDPVPIRYDTKYPAGLSENYATSLDPAAAKKLDDLQQQGFDRSHPKEYCEMDWEYSGLRLSAIPLTSIASECQRQGFATLRTSGPST
jgi:hypothetical protein